MNKLFDKVVTRLVLNPATGRYVKRQIIEKPDKPRYKYYDTKPNLMSSPDYVHVKRVKSGTAQGHGIWRPSTSDKPKGSLK